MSWSNIFTIEWHDLGYFCHWVAWSNIFAVEWHDLDYICYWMAWSWLFLLLSGMTLDIFWASFHAIIPQHFHCRVWEEIRAPKMLTVRFHVGWGGGGGGLDLIQTQFEDRVSFHQELYKKYTNASKINVKCDGTTSVYIFRKCNFLTWNSKFEIIFLLKFFSFHGRK